MTRIAIIGGGLAGLTAAHALKSHADVTVFDKARGVGGRMATRRSPSFAFDHGAQYFTARSEPFQQFLAPLIASGLIARWNATYARFEGSSLAEQQNWAEGEARYVATPGMNALAKHLATDIPVHTNTRITALKHDQTWHLHDEQGQVWGPFDWVICALPAQQAADLLPDECAHIRQVKAVDMLPCFALMADFSQPLALPFQAAHFAKCALSWMAEDSSKPGRKGGHTLLLHSSHPYAQTHLATDPNIIGNDMIAHFTRLTGQLLPSPDHVSVHRWLYANNAIRKELPVMLDHSMQIGICGDWTMGGRVEGAYLSAHHLCHALKEVIA